MRIYVISLILFLYSCSGGVNVSDRSQNLALQSDTLIKQGEFEEALLIIEEALKLDNKNYIAYNNLGYLKHELGFPESEVLHAFQKSYELNNDYLVGLYSLTNYQFYLKNYKRVLSLGKTYLDKVPINEGSVLNRSHILGIIGESYNYLDEFNMAIEYISESLLLDPQDAASYKERGTAYRNLGKNEDAYTDFNKAIELDSLYHQAYNSRAIYFDDLDLNDEALSDYNKAINIEPNSSIYLLNRAKLYIKVGNLVEACIDINRSYSLGNEEAHQYYLKYCQN